MTTRIYHNPRCSKSRAALALLEERHLEVEIIDYQSDPPTVEELEKICRMLGRNPLQIMRTKEARFKELGLTLGDRRSTREWLELIVENPILLERPIVVHGGRAALGRPPEQVLEVFD